jgi:hypothetical protein
MNWELNQPTLLVLPNFSKAFDSVCNNLKLCQSYSFHTTAEAFVSFYLFHWHHRLGCDDNFSSLAPLVTGVLQGSSILPLGFSLFIDDMTDVLKLLRLHMLCMLMICKFTTADREICSQ